MDKIFHDAWSSLAALKNEQNSEFDNFMFKRCIEKIQLFSEGEILANCFPTSLAKKRKESVTLTLVY